MYKRGAVFYIYLLATVLVLNVIWQLVVLQVVILHVTALVGLAVDSQFCVSQICFVVDFRRKRSSVYMSSDGYVEIWFIFRVGIM